MSKRFYIREVTGFLHPIVGSSNKPGITYCILDRVYNCRCVRVFRTEEHKHVPGNKNFSTREETFAHTKKLAREECARLNRKYA